MKNRYYQKVKKYFDKKASAYDDVDTQLYWVLSDCFFKEILKREIPKYFKNKKRIKILDAGAGTGRWTLFFYELFRHKYHISGHLIDLSEKMLAVAKEKIIKRNLRDRFSLEVGNVEEMNRINDNEFDLSLSFYNVISFVENPPKALKEIYKKLKKRGLHISIVANKYHAYYFAILTNRLKEIKMIKKHSKVRFNDNMPYIHCFTPCKLKKLYQQAGFRKVDIIGGPNFIYPGMEETFIHGNTKNIQNKLKDKDNFNKILEIEINAYRNNDIVGRGNVIMALAQK